MKKRSRHEQNLDRIVAESLERLRAKIRDLVASLSAPSSKKEGEG